MNTKLVHLLTLCLLSVVSAADYFPLAVGNEWTYENIEDSMHTTIFMQITQELAVDSGTVFKCSSRTSIAFPDYSTKSVGSDYILFYYSCNNNIYSIDSMGKLEPRRKFFEHNPQKNSAWNNSGGVGPQRIIYIGATTFKAGTFQSCYAVIKDDNNDTTWYAPDVGLVGRISDSSRFDLVSYKVSSSAIAFKRHSPQQLKVQHDFNQPSYSVADLLGRSVKSNTSAVANMSHGLRIYFNKHNEKKSCSKHMVLYGE